VDNFLLSKLLLWNSSNHGHHHYNPRMPGCMLQNVWGGPAFPIPVPLLGLFVGIPPLFKRIVHRNLNTHVGWPVNS